jgi:preprotein translocase subunit SecE
VDVNLKTQGADTADKVKLVVAVLLVVAGLTGYYLLDTQPAWERWLIVAAGVVCAAAVVFASRYGRDVRQFVVDARVELRKVVWPTRREAGMTTAVVFGFVVIAGIFFWLVDLLLAWATKHITGAGS